jgi:Flp pilus assembly protein TadB
MMFLLSNLNPGYMRVLFDDPKGPTILAIAGTLQLIGSVIIWKLYRQRADLSSAEITAVRGL